MYAIANKNVTSMPELNWKFDNSYARLPEAFFSRLEPAPAKEPNLVIFNHSLASEMGLDAENIPESKLAELFVGNTLPKGATPIAQAYAGHQFGHFTVLGDGRALVLGEHIAPDGLRYDIQFKGSGRTPYSRGGDGRAAIGPMLREYIISEAMAALGVPTTRSLAVVTTGEPVYRENILQGAILTRVAKSHLRVGTFEYAAYRRDLQGLSNLVDYAIDRHFSRFNSKENSALLLLKGVMESQIGLVVDWLRVGFIHGVMNTDNMTISGETIDYGPCAFMDFYDPQTAFSSVDHGRRYAFGNQPIITRWNLVRFAEALLPLIHSDVDKAVNIAEEHISAFDNIFKSQWTSMMRKKLGFFGENPEDVAIAEDFLSWMQTNKADYTNTFRLLCAGSPPMEGEHMDSAFSDWYARWEARRIQQSETIDESLKLMRTNNPVYIPRNHKVEDALNLASEKGDLTLLHSLLNVIADPYIERNEHGSYTAPHPPDYGRYQTFCGT